MTRVHSEIHLANVSAAEVASVYPTAPKSMTNVVSKLNQQGESYFNQFPCLEMKHVQEFDMDINDKYLWRYFGNTEYMSKAFYDPKRVAPPHLIDFPDTRGGSITLKTQWKGKKRGKIESRCLHLVYEWNAHDKSFSNYRIFDVHSLLKALFFGGKIESAGLNRIRVTYTGRFYGKNFLLKLAKPLLWMKFKKAVRQAMEDSFFYGSKQYLNTKPRNPNILERIKLLNDSEAAHRLAHYVDKCDDHDLYRIKPKVVADILQVPYQDLLIVLLSSARGDLFKMNFDLICPACRGAKESVGSLSEFQNKEVHCAVCNIKYDCDFDKNVAVSFTPTIQLRKLSGMPYCGLQPVNTEHVHMQCLLYPNQWTTRQFSFAGNREYFIRSPQFTNVAWRVVPAKETWIDTVNSIDIEYDPQLHTIQNDSSGRNVSLVDNCTIVKTFCVKQNQPITINQISHDKRNFIISQVQCTDHYEDQITTAFEIVNTPSFRQFFADDVLKQTEMVRIREVTMLFTDLKNSTEMYNKCGDGEAFSTIVEHFRFLMHATTQNNGVIVKSIGDSIFATFQHPNDGILAAIDMQEAIRKLNEEHDWDLVLKIGMHVGQTLLVNLNDRLDYFGNNVNKSSRIEGCCSEGDDLVLSSELYSRTSNLLDDMKLKKGVKVTSFKNTLKGFTEESKFYRVTFGNS